MAGTWLKCLLNESVALTCPALYAVKHFMTCLGNLLHTLKANSPYATQKRRANEEGIQALTFLVSLHPRACDCNKDFSSIALSPTRKKVSFSFNRVYRQKISLHKALNQMVPCASSLDFASTEKLSEISLNLLISIFFFSFCRLKRKSYFIALCTSCSFVYSSRQFKL